MESILSGIRKYNIGLHLSHQEFRQLHSRSAEVAASVLSNCYTRICFRLAETDAARFASGFSSFETEALQNLSIGEAIARIERADYDFNLKTALVPRVENEIAEKRKAEILQNTQEKYARSKAEVELEIIGQRQGSENNHRVQIHPASENHIVSNKVATKSKTQDTNAVSESSVASEKSNSGRGGEHHKEIQQAIKRVAESNGFSATIEKRVADGSIDVSLENENFKIAVEVSVTSSTDYEVKNIRKCLDAGYDLAVVVASDQNKIPLLKEKIQTQFSADEREKIKVSSLTGLLEFLWQLTNPEPKKSTKKSKGNRLNVAEASEFLGISTSTLYRWAREGRVPHFRVGRGYQFDKDELALIGRQNLSGKRKAVVDLPPIEIKKRTSKGKKQQDQRYRKMLNLE